MRIAILTELLGIGIVGTGIGVELAMRAHIWNVLITSGSVFIAAGGMYFAKTVKK